MMVLLWRIRSRFEDWYFSKKYSDKEPKIYYDRRFKCYVHPNNTDERGPAKYVACELTRSGIMYSYYLDGKSTHEHFFEGVIIDAYNLAESFKIRLEYNQYSQQQIELIERIQAHALQERKHSR